ncbi:MAG: hypothetical protein LBQ77_04215 [Treponema sp.]|nr:hypothetical protein [Treponema sp.]
MASAFVAFPANSLVPDRYIPAYFPPALPTVPASEPQSSVAGAVSA